MKYGKRACAASHARWMSIVVLSAGWFSAAHAFEPEVVPAPVERPSLKEAREANPVARQDALRQLYSPYMDDNYKRNIINELAKKQSLYPDQTAGANYPARMPLWRSIGPRGSKSSWNGVYIDGVDSGRIRNILVDRWNPEHVYLLTSGGGLWTTFNFSAQKPFWFPLTDGLLSTSGGAAALGRDGYTIYLGIGDPFDAFPTVAGVVVKSTDGGRTWSPFVVLPNATSIRDIKVDTSGANDVVLVATDVGLFTSADSGASYALSSVGQASGKTSVWSIAQSSAGWLVNAVDPLFDVGFGGGGELFISRDRGSSWNAIAAAGDVFPTVGRATLSLARAGESVVYAIAADFTGYAQQDLYRSNDGGLSWVALNITAKAPTNPNCFQPDLNMLGDQAWYNQMIAVSPKDPRRNTLYIGGNLSSAKTTDGGKTWKLLSSWLPTGCDNVEPALPYVHADKHAASVTMAYGIERVIFGTDGGIFVSYDGGASFDSDKNNGIVALLAQTIMSTPRREDSAITGLQDTGTRARLGGSQIWNQVLGGDGEGTGWSQANNAVTLASSQYLGIARQAGLPANTGNPDNWLDGTNGIDFDHPDCFPFYTPIGTPTAAADPTGLVFYTVTGSRLYKTVDGAASWQQVVQFGSVNSPVCYIRLRWNTIGLHPTDSKSIALGGAGGRILLSKDGGLSWKIVQLNTAVPGYSSFTSAPAWTNKGTLYVASESTTVGAIRLVKTSDGGTTWVRADAGLPDVAVNAIAVDPRDKNGLTVYAGTSIGVYVTRDGGASWSLYGAGLPNVSVVGLYLSPTEDFLRVATFGRGVWEIDLRRDH